MHPFLIAIIDPHEPVIPGPLAVLAVLAAVFLVIT